MSQVDNRNSSAAKRARTDGPLLNIFMQAAAGKMIGPALAVAMSTFHLGRLATCGTALSLGQQITTQWLCGIYFLLFQLFSFSMIQKFAAKPMQPMHGYSSPAPYVGSGAPSSMYMGVQPYGSSLFNGSSMPPYDIPFSGGSAYPYNYGSRYSGGSPYRSLHLSGPTPYSSGSMIGNGGMYGMPPLMDRYGLAVPMAHPGMGPRPGFFPEDKPQKKDVTRDNDWTCPKCGNVNFSFRTVCNMRKCNTPKPEPQAPKSDKGSKGPELSSSIAQYGQSQSCRLHVAAVVEFLCLSHDVCPVLY
ncbi:hypothetical protein C3L33_13349, partial [Rhododendron williamsianum]